MSTRFHAPSDCPVCGEDLIIISKGCQRCGTELHGEFAGTEFDALDDHDLDLLRVFLSSRGNLREVEKHLGVSYPTARSRYDAVLAKLGLTPHADPEARGAIPQRAEDWTEDEADTEYGTPIAQHDDLLARVAAGEVSAAEAASMLMQD
ncbi:DUF2089 domain-containing protein [uncultured Tessaracoccus sp.]|uniref:DUF2089 domain-containing protein n=1 Tax=uncultured Tessaracoccus sp. TaxID=905023 RepID=UPI0025F655D2|nr:DUF2089 family protein [uncultured Tessaracoccus sp.]